MVYEDSIHIYTKAELDKITDFGELQHIYRQLPEEVKQESHFPSNTFSNGDLIYGILQGEVDAFTRGLYNNISGIHHFSQEEIRDDYGEDLPGLLKLFEHAPEFGPGVDLVTAIMMAQREDFQYHLLNDKTLGED